jgi:alpha-tubulin suppressor-like RCC1 family protein
MTPTLLNITNITSICTGAYHTIILKSNQVYGFGNNLVNINKIKKKYGQLGIVNYTNRHHLTHIDQFSNIKSIHCGGQFTILVENTNRIWSIGINTEGQLGIGRFFTRFEFNRQRINFSGVKKIFTGFSNTFFVGTNNTLFGFGKYILLIKKVIYLDS